MLTLTAIVLALGLGWAVIRIWSAIADAPAATPTEEVSAR
jgi:hypothetical protein